MNPVYWWIIKDILGLRRDRRVKTCRRSRWGRVLGWGLALSIWGALWAGWWVMR